MADNSTTKSKLSDPTKCALDFMTLVTDDLDAKVLHKNTELNSFINYRERINISDYKVSGSIQIDGEDYEIHCFSTEKELGKKDQLKISCQAVQKSHLDSKGNRQYTLSKNFKSFCSQYQQKWYYHIRSQSDYKTGMSFSAQEAGEIKKDIPKFDFDQQLSNSKKKKTRY